jgi:hypothetical protein
VNKIAHKKDLRSSSSKLGSLQAKELPANRLHYAFHIIPQDKYHEANKKKSLSNALN